MPTKTELKEQNEVLRNVFLVIGIFLIIFLLGLWIASSAGSFEYKGVKFTIVDEIAPYRTKLPVTFNGTPYEYNFYLRNDPRKLDKVPFDGTIVGRENMVINMTEDFTCGGDGTIGIQNMINLYQLIGTTIIKDPEAGCDAVKGRYIFIQIRPGNETSIEQFAPTCYNFYVNDCEILPVTEKFMVETFAKIQGAK